LRNEIAELAMRLRERDAYIGEIRAAYSDLLRQARDDYVVAQKIREFYGTGYAFLRPEQEDPRGDFRAPP
jgi:hypothetical protein